MQFKTIFHDDVLGSQRVSLATISSRVKLNVGDVLPSVPCSRKRIPFMRTFSTMLNDNIS